MPRSSGGGAFLRSWWAQVPRQSAKQTKVDPSSYSSSSRISGLGHSVSQQYFLIRKMTCRSYLLKSRHAVRPITENPLAGLNYARFQSGSEKRGCKAPQLTPPCARMVLDGRIHSENSCSQALSGLLVDKWEKCTRREGEVPPRLPGFP